MPSSLRTLVHRDPKRLRVLTVPDDAVLDRPISWVHSSDLSDPTPWLEPGNLLLTNGAQFSQRSDAETIGEYCTRLKSLDLCGLGFATDIIHAEVPEEIVRGCAGVGLPLVEIGGRAPFIDIIRSVADVIAADRAARFSWLVEAQRAVAKVAVREDGLPQVLRTLSRLLNTWVDLYDATGSRMPLHELDGVPPSMAAEVGLEVRALLNRRTAASLLMPPPNGALLQTIGQSLHLRGVLAVGARERLDPAERDLVATVVAFASVALEQRKQLLASLRGVRAAVMEMMIAGQGEVARSAAVTAFGGVPSPPFHVGVLREATGISGLLDELDMSTTASDVLFFAERSRDVVLIAAEDPAGLMSSLAARRGLAAGIALHEPTDTFSTSVQQASAAARAAPLGGVREYARMAGRGLIRALRSQEGSLLADTVLRPLEALDPRERNRLVRASRAWLDANGAWDPAARELGIHRHTLRARISQIAEILELDLSTFAARAELWAALQMGEGARRDDPGGGSV